MTSRVFKLPDIGEGVVEGEVVQWHVSVGDKVAEDDALVDVMTDKATVTIPSPHDGEITALHGGVGDMVAVGAVLINSMVTESLLLLNRPRRLHQSLTPRLHQNLLLHLLRQLQRHQWHHHPCRQSLHLHHFPLSLHRHLAQVARHWRVLLCADVRARQESI